MNIRTTPGSNSGLVVAAAAVAVFLFGMHPAKAATASAPASDCALTASDIAQIQAVQDDPTLGYLAEVKAELAVRKTLLTKTIKCAQGDVDTLRTALKKAPVDPQSAGLEGQLSSKLDDASNFYDLELAKVNDSGISGSEAIAKELLAWRAGSFDPLSGNVNNFVLWAGNQNLFSAAKARMDETNRAVSFLLGRASNDDLKSAFHDAQSSFSAAENENGAAFTALSQFLPPDQSLTLIKQSLDDLSGTYKHFSDVSDLIKASLPK